MMVLIETERCRSNCYISM